MYEQNISCCVFDVELSLTLTNVTMNNQFNLTFTPIDLPMKEQWLQQLKIALVSRITSRLQLIQSLKPLLPRGWLLMSWLISMMTSIMRPVILQVIQKVTIKGSMSLPLKRQDSSLPSVPPSIMKTWGAQLIPISWSVFKLNTSSL